MITLENGDKWIIDDKEITDLDYDEACKGNVPITDIQTFVESLCEARRYDNENRELLMPRKLTKDGDGGYWDCNFDVFTEVFGVIARFTINTPWSKIYEMPWGTTIVVFIQADCGGYDVETATKIYDNYSAYLDAADPHRD